MSVKQSLTIEQPLGRRLSLVGKDFLSCLNAQLNHIDLERNYYALLLIAGNDGVMTQQELSSQLEIDKVSIVRIIDYLTDKGYVTRIAHKLDRRKYCLTLTDKAKSNIADIQKSMEMVKAKTFSGLNETQISEFLQTLSIIEKNLKNESI